MHVQHTSMLTREKRHRRIEDAEKRRKYRIAHGLEEPDDADATEAANVDNPSPLAANAVDLDPQQQRNDPVVEGSTGEQYRDFEGRQRPVKKWLGIW
jgi:hypothetical protein